MQKEDNLLKFRRHLHVRFLLLLSIFPSFILTGESGNVWAETDNPTIVYAKSGTSEFSATLVYANSAEIFPYDRSLVNISVNGTKVPFEFQAGKNGKCDLNGSLPSLPDGKHLITLETYNPDNKPIEKKEALLLVDSVPPLIELVEPMGHLPRFSSSVLFMVEDPGNGSGVAADPLSSHLQVEVEGAEIFSKNFVLKEDLLHLLVTLDFEKETAPPDHRIEIQVSLKDRAGNTGEFSKEFFTTSLTPPMFIQSCLDTDSCILNSLGILVYPENKGLQLRRGVSQPLSFLMYGNYGNKFKYPVECANDYGKPAPEFSRLSKFFQKEIGRRIMVVAGPDSLLIERLDDNNFTDNRITFQVTQKTDVPMGKQVDSILVRVPVAFSLDKSIKNCPFDDYEKMPANAFSYDYNTISIPVVQEIAEHPIKFKIHQEDDTLVSQVKFDTINLLDTAASWFGIEGKKHWFEIQDDLAIAKGPANEGRVHYTIAATHKVAEFQNQGEDKNISKRTYYYEGEYIVRMSPPAITGFRYDRQANTLIATITDTGTPPEDLEIQLEVLGRNLDFNFDILTRVLTAGLTFTPQSVLNASLKVTDLADQMSSATCTILGNPKIITNSTGPGFSISNFQTKAKWNDPTNNVISVSKNGLHFVKVCSPRQLQWGFYNQGEFVALSPHSASLIRLRAKDSRKILPPPSGHNVPGKYKDQGAQLFYNHYDSSLYEQDNMEGSRASISIMPGAPAQKDTKQNIYYITGYYDGDRFVPTDHNLGLRFTTKTTKDCRIVERDISSPVVRVSYDPRSGLVTGRIHDFGTPLSLLTISFLGRNDHRSAHPYEEDLTFEFQDGYFSGRFTPPEQGEFFVLEIKAVDQAGNAGISKVRVVIPRLPPVVEVLVEAEETNRIFGNHTNGANVYISAEATDDSEIIAGNTTLWLDGQILPPLHIIDANLFQAHSNTFQKNHSHYERMFAAKVKEGPHNVRFRATDSTGLSSETVKRFEFRLAPEISNLKVMPEAVLNAGGPPITALIIDRGGDLHVSGLSLSLNGDPINRDRFFYDSASGYFAVEGPLDLTDGSYTVNLKAVDARGNVAEETLHFRRRLQVIIPAGLEDSADFSIDTASLMELRDHNGDGQANPGEMIRLFISLRNDSQQSGKHCRTVLTTGNENVIVETQAVIYGRIEAGSISAPIKGFDLQISQDVLSGVVSDPHDIHLDLKITCSSEKDWRLPFSLPVYRPSIPVNITSTLNLTIDELPAATNDEQIVLQGLGASSSSYIEMVTVRVNGGPAIPAALDREGGQFQVTLALQVGPNTIEVEVIDQSGARSFATRFVQRAPIFIAPEIVITTPPENSFFQCGDLTITGTYNAGSSDLERIMINAPLWAFDAVCPVTIVDGSHFIANCGQITEFGGTYNIEAILETTQGIQVKVSKGIIVGDCF